MKSYFLDEWRRYKLPAAILGATLVLFALFLAFLAYYSDRGGTDFVFFKGIGSFGSATTYEGERASSNESSHFSNNKHSEEMINSSSFINLSGNKSITENEIFKRYTAADYVPVLEYEWISNTEMIDPGSLKIGIEPSIPFTYNASIEQSAVYLKTMLHVGWVIIRAEAGDDYLDHYLKREDEEARIIIFDGSLKVFYWRASE